MPQRAYSNTFRYAFPLFIAGIVFISGCGTMKTSNSSRTATEQLIVTDALDRAIDEIDFSVLAGKKIYLDVSPLPSSSDSNYLASSIRQQVLGCGALLMEEKKDADYVVEVRAGAIGTDEHEIVYGIPEITTPTFVSSGTVTIPEIAVAKRLGQKATAKIAVFAYNRKTGMPLWQSGMHEKDSNVKNVWVLGGGPYRTGDIIEKPQLLDTAVDIPLADIWNQKERNVQLTVRDQAYFVQNNSERTPGKDQPVLRMRSAPEAIPDSSSLIAMPEGINIPSQERLASMEKENPSPEKAPDKETLAESNAPAPEDDSLQQEGIIPAENAPQAEEIIATSPNESNIR